MKILYTPYDGSSINIHNDTSEPKEPFESETELIQNSNQHSMTLISRIRINNSDSMSGSDSNDSDDSEKISCDTADILPQ